MGTRTESVMEGEEWRQAGIGKEEGGCGYVQPGYFDSLIAIGFRFADASVLLDGRDLGEAQRLEVALE